MPLKSWRRYEEVKPGKLKPGALPASSAKALEHPTTTLMTKIYFVVNFTPLSLQAITLTALAYAFKKQK
ncbi:hypothetical protein [Pseudomonas sp. PS01297]|uniref:hypothetical protein n=1 Tax=Pseudomonas sp. PS01297 TaxID=2991433 RepID=UPI00249C0562|nr:hypothetical protein [Pseudomonas sp. PS01297]